MVEIRWKKVLEIKAIIEQYSDFSRVEQSFFVFLERNTADQGFTIYELIASFFPKAIVSLNGVNQVLSWGFRRMILILARLREFVSARSMVPYAQKVEGLHVYFNNERSQEQQLTKRMKNVCDGANEHLALLLEALNLPAKARKKLEREIKKTIIQKHLEKKRKKKELLLQA